MDIKNLKQKKKEVESQIRDIFLSFESETGTTIDRVGITRAINALGETKDLYIQLDASI